MFYIFLTPPILVIIFIIYALFDDHLKTIIGKDNEMI